MNFHTGIKLQTHILNIPEVLLSMDINYVRIKQPEK